MLPGTAICHNSRFSQGIYLHKKCKEEFLLLSGRKIFATEAQSTRRKDKKNRRIFTRMIQGQSLPLKMNHSKEILTQRHRVHGERIQKGKY